MTLALSYNPSPRQIAVAVNQLLKGKSNNAGSVTLQNATSTTVTDEKVGIDTYIQFMPLNASAASELASGNMYVSAQTAGTGFTITHTTGTGRDFRYVLIG